MERQSVRDFIVSTIGLFPLEIVLFPGSSYPLHIFEPRYKQLIGESLASETEFGINLVDSGKMSAVGCRASVSAVLETYDDGRMDIVVTGTDRYRIDSYHAGEKPYLVAEIHDLEDQNPQPDFDLLNATIALYNQLVESVYGEAEDILDPSDWIGGGASFRMAQKSGLDLSLRQQLLEMRSETVRLQIIHDHLEELVPKIKKMEQLQMLIRNDGYLKSW